MTIEFSFPGYAPIEIDGRSVTYGQDSFSSLSQAFSRQRSLGELWQQELNHLDAAYAHYDIDYQDAEETEFSNPLFVWQRGIVIPPIDILMAGTLSIADDVLLTFHNQQFVVLQNDGEWFLGYQRDHHHPDYDSYDLEAYFYALYWVRHYLPLLNIEALIDRTDIYKPSTYQHYDIPPWGMEEYALRHRELQALQDVLDITTFLTPNIPFVPNESPLFL